MEEHAFAGAFVTGLPRNGQVMPKRAMHTALTVETPHTRELDDLLADELSRLRLLRPVEAAARPRLPREDLLAEVALGTEKHAAAAETLAETCANLHAGRSVPRHRLDRLVGEFCDMIALDFDLLPMIVSGQASREHDRDYLFDHSVDTACVSMVMASQLGMNRRQVMELGLGALLQDVGMLGVDPAMRRSPRSLTAKEKTEVEYHPIHTVDCLSRVEGLPVSARLVGYQVHERSDRSGYPRRRSGAFIHQYPRIVAIADAYTAMIRPRPHRRAVLPHEAVKNILIDGGLGKYDLMMLRAFLDVISLFPIGSWVELNDGTTAEVVRANPGSHTRPVVAEMDEAGEPTGTTIDLAMEPGLKILRAIPPASQWPEPKLLAFAQASSVD